ncbi:SGNH/GDSL hydrolase family protein [Mycetocola miduiensis]|uniref:Lysophospholipase L1 n=1 Tax=Mycetocola miduiensis TaxID=995034 RepID=A0A1I4YQD3_9MICO|nr:SGNH/GDSL hydrolase family protein [Mycetocola miduiensis]SFN40226.1 Lysophospholipase L1 [Mycetocola miduiensis]
MKSRAARILTAVGLALAATTLTACTPAGPGDGLGASHPPGQTVAAFYGDSYTRGTGVSDPELRWSTQLSEDRGWAEINPSVDGLGFVVNRDLLRDDLVELIVAEDPDIVVVTMGLNDNFAPPEEAAKVESAIRDDLSTFANELPDARLIVVEPFWHTERRPASVDTIIGWVRDAAADVGADYIPGASRWLEGHPEWIAPDGIHPNDTGHAEIAERMGEELAKLGL